MTPSKMQVVTGDANAGEDARTTAGLETGATERSPFSCPVVSRRIMDDYSHTLPPGGRKTGLRGLVALEEFWVYGVLEERGVSGDDG